MLDDIRNNIDFFIRNKTKFSRKNFVEKNPKLIARNIKENQYIQDILDNVLKKQTKQSLRILDIGCKNWFYATGEYNYFKKFCSNFVLDGVELDAYRLYSNFYNRYETAKYYTKNLENTNYIAGNLLDLKNKYDYIIWILPFVTINPLIYWGLPKKFFQPTQLLEHAYNLLNDNGQMLIVNQGEIEYNQQKILLEKLKIPFIELGEITSIYFEYEKPRYGYLIKK